MFLVLVQISLKFFSFFSFESFIKCPKHESVLKQVQYKNCTLISLNFTVYSRTFFVYLWHDSPHAKS